MSCWHNLRLNNKPRKASRMNKLLVITFCIGSWVMSSISIAKEFHVGNITAQKLAAQYPDFSAKLPDYQVNQEDIVKLNAIKQEFDVIALFGTWCHDSEREIPRLVNLFEQIENERIKLKLKGVGLDKKVLKSATDKSVDYQLKFTPTIIVYHQGQEIGRIIERPTTTIAQDLLTIMVLAPPH